ncbi:MAG: GNAT family N-acetyltransferase [Rhodothermales bacterium]|nr:GNAT family N-acetyltransferase [Rhodothermales bacterium]
MNAAEPTSMDRRDYPRNPSGLPDASGSEAPATDQEFDLAYARSPEELDEIQRLRYTVFNLELNEGLDESHITGRDSDDFDPYCHHVYVRHRASGTIAGTYRMQTIEMARDGIGLYSATEFDFGTMPDEILDEAVEIGRACIRREFRSLKVLYMLWKGLGRYVGHNRKSFVFGCCSLTSQDQNEGAAVYRQLERDGHLHESIRVEPLLSHACLMDPDADFEVEKVSPPRLMRAYLSFGARICSPPAIDRQFKTIDFLAVFDTESLEATNLAFYRIT